MKKIFFVLLFLPLTSRSQNNVQAKGIFMFNAKDTAAIINTRNRLQNYYGNTGGIFFNPTSNKLRVWDGTQWVTIPSASGGGNPSPPIFSYQFNDGGIFGGQDNFKNLSGNPTLTGDTYIDNYFDVKGNNQNGIAGYYLRSGSVQGDFSTTTFSDNNNNLTAIGINLTAKNYGRQFITNRPSVGLTFFSGSSVAINSSDPFVLYYQFRAINSIGVQVNPIELYYDQAVDVWNGVFRIDKLYQKGNISINSNVSPNAQLDIGAGTTTFAPINLTAGQLLTTPLAGRIESDGTHIYWTNSSGVRKQLD